MSNITQLINNNGNPAANQFVISTDKGLYFQSYETLIAFVSHDGLSTILTDSWCYSNTTLKHLKIFLGTSLSKKDLIKRIDSGDILIDNSLKVA